ncbi:MAG: RnfABCDGE type electron transport complex subunit G [Prevotellaceae bacterium]|jgi:electron transport complex protein RnfG|nr:RnfABCDGE type electron transport complex subunit G [Prevotellaceae bacterium]
MAKESTFKNMVLTLLIITLLSAAALGGAYVLTKETIDLGKIKKVNDAIAQVVPEFDNNPSGEVIKKGIDGDTVKLYPAKKDGKLVGMAAETFTKSGFSGLITLMVGFLPDGTINDITVISHNETPGLGDKIEKGKSNFSIQFEGKNPLTTKISVSKDGGEIDAITASTISSRAYCDAVNRAFKAFLEETTGDSSWEGASGATSATNKNKQINDGTSDATLTGEQKTNTDGNTGSTTPTTDTVKVNKEDKK